MEGIGSEVSHKIRAAIKAKLIELGAYVDDELPDYIMVMVANKRTRSQMDEDLQLFLTSNTKIFTSWLHTVLQKLQEVTVASFEGKKDGDSKKLSKRKRSECEDGIKSRKSSEEVVGKVKKHSKKHKGAKKTKKNKHKNKEKVKSKTVKKEENESKSGKETKDESLVKTSHPVEKDKKSKEKSVKSKKLLLNDAVGKAILGDLKKNEKLKEKNDFSSRSSSSSENSSVAGAKANGNLTQINKPRGNYQDEDVLNIKGDDEPGGMGIDSSIKIRNDLVEDEFNIEPLKPTEKSSDIVSVKDDEIEEINREKDPAGQKVQTETTISAPTEELLKEHDKLQSEKLQGEENEKKNSDSEESLSPEEMRKQLLLSRAKKKLEESKLAERMRSNSPDVLILDERNKSTGKQKDLNLPLRLTSGKQTEFRQPRFSPVRSNASRGSSRSNSPSRRSRKYSSSHSSNYRSRSRDMSPSRKVNLDRKTKPTRPTNEDRRRISLTKADRNSSPLTLERGSDSKNASESREKKKTVIKISESMEMEKNLGVKKEEKKSKEVATKRRPISSRVVTISEPDAPEISSIVKVKPRQYISKDKQANKALILKAVADAEKSIATVHTRNESEPEAKKMEALFTKNLRGKRYEKLAVTLSNIRKSPDSRDQLDRKVSMDSEKSDRSRAKQGSSDLSEGIRNRSDVPSKRMSRSEDQFISSKTTVMEKNDKYIRFWLEGVEKAVKEDEMVNPNEMEDFSHSNYTDEDNDFAEKELIRKEDERKRKKQHGDEILLEKPAKNQKLTDTEIANLRLIPNSGSTDDGPQIVVTLDGLNSKTIKDIIYRNREAINGPILSSSGKKSTEKDTKDKSAKTTQRNSDAAKEKSPVRKSGFEKISDRFARLNKTSKEEFDKGKGDKRKNQSSDREKKDKSVTESKNRQLIAQLSEKFGKVDREFENKKRKYSEDDRRHHESRRSEKEDERNGKYKRSDRRSGRDELPSPQLSKFPSSSSSQICKFYPNCKNSDCRYFHPTKCRFDDDCTNPDCKYLHSESSVKKKPKWYSKS